MWKKLIEDLLGEGLKEQEIANRVKTKGVRTTQPTINRIKKGVIESPRYELGQALVNLHLEVCKIKRVPKRQELRA